MSNREDVFLTAYRVAPTSGIIATRACGLLEAHKTFLMQSDGISILT